MGESTDGIHQLVLFLPPPYSTFSTFSLALPVQPWIPLQVALNPVMSALPAPEPVASMERAPRVYRHGLNIMPFGLFPAISLASHVRVPCVFNTPIK